MKTGWRIKAIGELCVIKPPKSEARAALAPSDPVSFVPMEDLPSASKFLSPSRERSLSEVIGGYTYFADGDVLLAKITPCFENGKLGVAANLTNGVGFGSSEYLVLRPDSTLSSQWLYYYLSRKSFRVEGASRMSGAVGHKRVPQEFLERYPIPVPPLTEQERIVAILDQASEAIETAKENAEKSELNAQELFDSYLGGIFATGGKGWVSGKLASFCREITVGHVGSMAKRYVASGIPFLRSQNIRAFDVSLTNVVYIDEVFHAALSKSKLAPNDVAIVRTGYPGTAAVIPESLKRANCADLVIVRPLPSLNPHFLAAFFNSSYGKSLVGGKLVGAAQKHFNVTAAKEATLHVPPLEQQNEIVEQIAVIRAEADRLAAIYHQKLVALDMLRESTMSQAFNGNL